MNQIKPDILSYEKLRKYGIDYITRFGSNLWTDHNIHDPGITTLELLCYALTDLGYRTSFDIKDILTPRAEKRPQMQDTFIPADKILVSHPVTDYDIRKWILENIPCVRNVRIEESNSNLLGLYDIYVDINDFELLKDYRITFGRKRNGRYITKKEYESDIKRYCRSNIRNILLKHRNLCEDISDIRLLDNVYVGICADIEIKPDVKYEPVIKEISKRINEYISPTIPFYTLEQMLEKGKSVEEIYQGSVPRFGFIDMEELNRFDNKKQLNCSDVVNLIMSIDGVVNVRHIHFTVNDEDIKNQIISSTNHYIKLNNDKNYSFRFYSDDPGKTESLNDIVITRGLLTFRPDVGLQVSPESDRWSNPDRQVELPLPSGKNREIDQYFSIQDEYPKTYKVGREGITDRATDLRKAQRLQFKAYLLFFDQLLSDYLMQLDSVKDVLSWKDEDNTYFFKNLSDDEITDFSKVFTDYSGYGKILEPESLKSDRRNRFLNHLIARFNEEFVDYSILKFINQRGATLKDFDDIELINDKKEFLKNYASISRNRSRAFDYTEPILDSKKTFFERDNTVCGLEMVLYNKLGINSGLAHKNLALKTGTKKRKIIFKDNRDGNYNENFGLNIYEHILLRPLPDCKDESTFLKFTTDINQTKIVEDPYSMQITIVLPGWLKISENIEFRKFVERTIHTEVPAHIAAKICWLNPYHMYLLETRYEKFLSVLAQQQYPLKDEAWEKQHTKALIDLVEIFSSLRSVYPSIRLYKDVYRANEYSAVLDHSTLGGYDNEDLWEYETNMN